MASDDQLAKYGGPRAGRPVPWTAVGSPAGHQALKGRSDVLRALLRRVVGRLERTSPLRSARSKEPSAALTTAAQRTLGPVGQRSV